MIMGRKADGMADEEKDNVLPIVQAVVAVIAMSLATFAGVRGIVPGDALIGLYSATVGFIFGSETYRRGVVRGRNGG